MKAGAAIFEGNGLSESVARSILVQKLQDRIHDAVGRHLMDQPFALLDFPDHPNVGDSAIWLGEIEYFRTRFRQRPSYVCRHWDYSSDQLEATSPEGPVFIHGGGNFGDIWEHHQKFREHLLTTLKHRQIVQLPQSIQFWSDARRDDMARAIDGHPNFTLLVRDRESLELAEKHFNCPTELVPDMALCLGVLQPDEPRYDVLALLRTDSEKAGIDQFDSRSVRVEDWLSEPVKAVRTAKAVGSIEAVASLRFAGVREAMSTAAARHRVKRGRAQLSAARAIVTDRLHVHILSLLLGRPHAVLDNSYGKIRRFMAAWTGSSDLGYRAETMPAAIDWALAQARATEMRRTA